MEGYFYNPNIHPFPEYLRRFEALSLYQEELGIPVRYAEAYRPEEYFRAVLEDLENRCRRCYELRLRATAREAARHGAAAFSTTLLFSVYQKHDLLREAGERVAAEEGVPFLYRDLRPGWEEGGRRYRERGLYRQNYCGCLFSEKERIENKGKAEAKQGNGRPARAAHSGPLKSR